MPRSVMIAVYYNRTPNTELYELKIDVRMLIVEEGAEAKEEKLLDSRKHRVRMESIIADVHELLQTFPDALVTMIRETTRPMLYGQRPPRGFTLDYKMRDLIRDDLHEALKAFAPIERVVKVRPTSPSIKVKE